jgi:GntR family transcriptional regulator, transcriptional repressor for pyruvate dehydrogenase complex
MPGNAGKSRASQATVSFGPAMSRQRLSDRVAASILDTVTRQGLRPGDALPSQRDLGEQYGVSRTVIREAVGSLAARGVIEVRAGSGLRLTAVDASSVTESVRFFVRTSDVLDYGKVHEVRAMLETHIAGLAAYRATDLDIETIKNWLDRLANSASDMEAAAQCDMEFHRAIARAVDNELYLVLLDSIHGALLDIKRTLMPGRLEKTVREHKKIADRIAAGDAPGARLAMQQHLETVEEDWRHRLPGEEST